MTSNQPIHPWVRPVRLGCGLLLFAFLLTHFGNHALGLVSLHAMEEGRLGFLALWRNPVGESALFGALLAHWLLGLWLIYQRRTLRMPVWEATQIILGLIVPTLLAYHLIGTRMANAMYGSEDLYARVIFSLWVQNPWAGTYDRVQPWVHRTSLLVALPAVVRARFPRLVCVFRADACTRVSGSRRGGPRGVCAGAPA